ncbi:ImpA family metalloprotease [Photobacterium atrarenae]|uniref:ImpA family metalloprotease n=1 Tax=Photobacterium atrarenae TaxID=865757 RepID=A0ABY5GKZ2_9GAMM|nr:ImpA family metalloprotease [Photobacterium atrarenae]UTV29993.1 ImpA family metalloprotease [Photobacterium atrarenae]
MKPNQLTSQWLTFSSVGLLVACGSDGPGATEQVRIVKPLKAAEYTLTSQASVGGMITPSAVSVVEGQQYIFSITPEDGYVLDTVTGCHGQLTGSDYQTGVITSPCEVRASFLTHAEAAVKREDHTLASADELIDFSREQIQVAQAKRQALVDTLYQNVGSTIAWHPSHDSITLSSFLPAHTMMVLRSTQEEKGKPSAKGLVYVGEQAGHRYAAMAANMFAVDNSAQTDQLLKNLLDWMTGGAGESKPLSVVTTHMSSHRDSWYFPHNEKIRAWLETYYPGRHVINTANRCEYSDLASCIQQQKPDVIVMSDVDRNGQGSPAGQAVVELARANHIPLIYVNHERFASPLAKPVFRYMGLQAEGNYWPEHLASDLSVQSLKEGDAQLQAVDHLLVNLKRGHFDPQALENCDRNFIYCNDTAFNLAFRNGADWFRQAATGLDTSGIQAFSSEHYALIKAGLLLADKYRAAIDYPITPSEPEAWQQAMFADWVVSYARTGNLAQPDLGEFIIDASQVRAGHQAHYAYPATETDMQDILVPYSHQWTTTGWYALPGQPITISRQGSSDARLTIKLNYHRSNTNRTYQTKIYRGPLEVMQQRITVEKGDSVTFSTPYGGPIYAYLEGSASPVSVTLKASGIAKHPAVLDFSDPTQISRFNQALETTELPHVDLRTDGAEQHLRRDRFLDALNDEVPTVNALLKSIEEDHLNSVYTLAGYKVQGSSLTESLPDDVKAVCQNLFGATDCFDPALHTRKIIQHANYDQNAQCGSGCSGNPWDAAWEISPTSWGDNHELGHNLQTKRLNVHYVVAADKENWRQYGSRAGENSNNIFPYYVKWKSHYVRDGKTTPLTDGHMNHKDLFYVFMSDAAQVKNSAGERVVLNRNCEVMDEGQDRFTVPWRSNDYAVHNSYRMAFYIQMALRADQQVMASGDKLSNGFHLFTLLYQHSRIFGQYAANESDWLAHRAQLGFSGFDYQHSTYGDKTVSSMPGNDFMLVALSVITGQDWRPYFDMFGLHYTSLAADQVSKNTTKGAVPVGMYVLEDDLPPGSMSTGLDFLALSETDPTTRWPRNNSSPSQCDSL